MSHISHFISKILLMLAGVFVLCFSATAQKTAQDYANETSKLYVDGKSKEAKRMVSRGLEVYENDTTLKRLQAIIARPNENNQKQNDKSEDKNEQNEDKQNEQNKQNQDNQNQDQQQQQQQNQQQNDNSEQKKDEKGKISETEAEMILRALENSEKEVQQRLMERKNEDLKQRMIDKNW
ncbi:MAG: hypothetical protein FWC39_06330 [Bacteroidetes bacterium]|nr:hypothetical protein [Bacteroidota bacterium]